jgi:transcription initiation factor IIF auxiliary subunit
VDFETCPEVLDHFANLDDYDILGALKVWKDADDRVLSSLARRLVNRELFKIEIATEPFGPDRIQLEKEMVRQNFGLEGDEVDFFVYSDRLSNNAYNQNKQNINMLMKNGEIIDLSKASDNLNISALASPVEKFFLCYPI